jgi:ABC-type dipeptide/oligopeptide/nickel transport system ATPase component
MLYKGVVVEEGALDEIVRNPKSEHAKLLIASYALGASGVVSPLFSSAAK